MADAKLGAAEGRFADLIWQNEPLSSSLLAKLAEEELGWKKSTSYTVLKRLCDRGIFANQQGTVRSLLSREDFYAARGEQFLQEGFQGSLPAFLAAFSKRNKLSDQDIQELQELIQQMRREPK
ncbi:BlaI/MecI/CopY family transcriptional regulator [Fournierella massiliensis]|nr:BlaI/MecI/CopY family transcriptional regulator [Fournierella massiliensis]MCF2557149.1 BlaI/MecI/CopY family transcriptional regulator [Fournierella massiliensis]